MNHQYILALEPKLVSLAATARLYYMTLEEYLSYMREALCTLVDQWTGTEEELLAVCQRYARRMNGREQRYHQRTRELFNTDTTPINPKSFKGSHLRRRNYGGTGERVDCTLAITDIANLTLEERHAVVSNLYQRRIITRDIADILLLEVHRLPSRVQAIALAILCSFTVDEILSAGYQRGEIVRARALLRRTATPESHQQPYLSPAAAPRQRRATHQG